MTAAHCCVNSHIGTPIFFGTTTPFDSTKNRVMRQLKEYFIHPDFKVDTLEWDICMIKLNEPLEFGPNVRPICLVEEAPATQLSAYIAGWGLTSEGGQLPHALMEVSVPIIQHDHCKVIICYENWWTIYVWYNLVLRVHTQIE